MNEKNRFQIGFQINQKLAARAFSKRPWSAGGHGTQGGALVSAPRQENRTVDVRRQGGGVVQSLSSSFEPTA